MFKMIIAEIYSNYHFSRVHLSVDTHRCMPIAEVYFIQGKIPVLPQPPHNNPR